MKIAIAPGTTSQILRIFAQDATTGLAKTGLTYSSFTWYWMRIGDASPTVVSTTGTGALGTYTSGLILEISAANMPGIYEIGVPNSAINAGTVHMSLTGTGFFVAPIEIQTDNIPANTLAWKSGTIPSPNVTGVPKVDVVDVLGNAPTTTTSGVLDVNVKNYNNHAAVTDANNLPKVDVEDILGNAPTTTTSGVLDVNVKNYNNQAAVTDTNNLPKVDVEDILGTLYSGAAGYFVDWSKIQNVTSSVNFVNTTVGGATTLGGFVQAIMSRRNIIITQGTATGLTVSGSYFCTSTYSSSRETYYNYTTNPYASIWYDGGNSRWTISATVGANTNGWYGPSIKGPWTAFGGTYAGVPVTAWVSGLPYSDNLQNLGVDSSGAITAVTSLTNAPTAGDFTSTMKTSLNAATPTVSVNTAAVATAVWQDNTAGDFTVSNSAGYKLSNISGGGGGGGTGANTVTINVTDGTHNIQNATVSVWGGSVQVAYGTTGVSGNAIVYLNNGTYSVAITASGYNGGGGTLVVIGPATQSYTLTVLSVSPSTPPEVTGYTTCYDQSGNALGGVVHILTQSGVSDGSTGASFSKTPVTAQSSSNGLVQFTGLIPGATYYLQRGQNGTQVKFTAANTNFALPDCIG